jgi:outer membrane protein TolC
MSIRAQVWAWAAVGLFAVPAAQERPAGEIVELIVREGPRAAAIRAEVEVTRREQFARLAYPNPAVTYSREGAGFTEFLEVEQRLPWFGARPALERAGESAAAASEALRDLRLNALRAEAATAVAGLQGAQDQASGARAHVEALRQLIGIVATREREGEGSRFDRLRAEQELYDAERVVVQADVAVAAALARIHELLPPSVRITGVAGTVYAAREVPAGADLLARATEARAELRALDASAAQADHEATAARLARRPVPTVFGGFKRADVGAGRESSGIFGISVSVPLLNRGTSQAARWAAESSRIAAERAAVAQQVRAEVEGARATLAIMQDAVAADAPAAADELARIAELAYVEGEISILAWLDAVRTTFRARSRSIDIRLDARLAQIALERAVGESLWP